MHYPEFQKEKVNFTLTLGGLGDNIARMVAMKYISERHPHVIPIIWVADYFYPIAKNMLPDVRIEKFSNTAKYNKELPGRTTGNQVMTNLKMSMVDHAFCLLANEVPSIEYKNYIPLNLKPIGVQHFDLPEKYVVMTCAYTAPIREFLPEYINEINDYIIHKGYKIVFLGQEVVDAGVPGFEIIGKVKPEIDFSKGINLINKTSLLQAAKIMSEAKAVVGLDNGLGHLAACSDVSVVQGYTSVNPIHRMPTRHNQFGWRWFPVVPPENEPERFCQSIWDFQFTHDFKFSYYQNDSLIKSLTPDLYIEQLERIL